MDDRKEAVVTMSLPEKKSSTKDVDDFFSDNDVVTTASFLSSKTLPTFSIDYMMYFPLTFSSKLVESIHRLIT